MDADAARRRRRAKVLRMSRSVHRMTGALLFAFFFVVALTGLLLGWKKDTGGIILAETHQGSSGELKDWLPIDVLREKAVAAVRESVSPDLSPELDRIDIRPDKGVAKFVFVEHYWGVQLDGATGAVLHVERRRADFIENVHDGSVLDYLAGTGGGQIKLVYTSIMGAALLTFTVTGFWLWYGPKWFRAHSKYHRYNI
jgi:uncharacterized iron-regulated membrane protein